MKKLPKKLTIKGTGIPNLKATLVERTDNICLYKRSDGAYEVFYPNIIKKGTTVFNKTYDEDTECYASTSDFGVTAWCFSRLEYAQERYIALKNKPISVKSDSKG